MHIIRTLLLLLMTFATASAQLPHFGWVSSFGGDSVQAGRYMTVDRWANIYTAGVLQSVAKFGTSGPTLTSKGGLDLFISKMDSAGNLIWAESFGGPGWDNIAGISSDHQGNIYLAGTFTGTIDMDPGPGVFNLNGIGNGTNIYMLKLDSNGSFVWAKELAGYGMNYVIGFAMDTTANLYLTGFFTWSCDFDPGSGSTQLISTGYEDAFIASYDSAGAYRWVKTINGPSSQAGYSIAVSNMGYVYAQGIFRDTTKFNLQNGTVSHRGNTTNGGDVYVVRFNTAGSMQKMLTADNLGDAGANIRAHLQTNELGEVYLGGMFLDTMIFRAANRFDTLIIPTNCLEGYLAGFNSDLDIKWAKVFKSPYVSSCEVTSIAFDKDMNVYAGGTYSGSIDFDPGPATSAATNNGGTDVFIVKLDTGGRYLWATTVGGGSEEGLTALTVDDAGNLYATGGASGYVDFDNGPGVAGVTAVKDVDAWFLKLRVPSVNSTAIKPLIDDHQLILYPNPATGVVTLASNRPFSNASVSLITGSGQLIKCWKAVSGRTFSTDLGLLSAGTYLLSISDDDGDRRSIILIKK